MATIRKRGFGQWQVQVRRVGFETESATFESKIEAQEWASQIESAMVRGVHAARKVAERMKLSDLVGKFKESYAPMHYKAREDGKEAWKFQLKHIDDKLGEKTLAELDQKLVAEYRDERLKLVSGGTVRKELYLLSKVLGFAEMELGICLPGGNPVSKIRKPIEAKGRDRRLSDTEWSELEQECRKSRNTYLWPAVCIARETCMRQGEILSVKWQDVDWKRKFVFLHDTKNGEARAVPLSPMALEILKNLPRSITGNIFPIQRMTLLHAFQGALKRAKIADFRFHDLRHEGISRLAERGDFSVLDMAAVSGHKTLTMLSRYTHINAEKLADKLATTK
ncbi:site-specific integrase [Limnobacter sp.]|uniref:site-specific integrase n=1 Tax=Limnobacter sp. TaxID=2003368 RepID=UPI0027BAD896|nr:site-specific integrase [Limnobacter sp.]